VKSKYTRHATDLVRACDKTQLVFLQEILDNVSAERERHTSVILAPTSYVLYIIAVQPFIYTVK